MKKFIICMLLVLITTSSFASVNRVDITKDNQAEAEIKFTVTIEELEGHQKGYSEVKLTIPPNQKKLDDFWKAYLWISENEKTSLSVPLETIRDKDNRLIVRFSGKMQLIKDAIIALRCGKHAPFAENIYQIRIGTYIKKK